MNIGANGKALATATKELMLKWEDTRQSWQDAKADEFEQKYMVVLQATMDRVMPVFDDLDKVVSRVRNECE